MIDSHAVMWKIREILGRDLEADELHMLGRLLKANENNPERSEDWYVDQLLELIEDERIDVPDEQLSGKTYWVEPNRILEVE